MHRQLSLDAYGVTYAHFDGHKLQFESEAALQLEDGSMLTLRLPTRRSEALAIRQALCQHQTCDQAT